MRSRAVAALSILSLAASACGERASPDERRAAPAPERAAAVPLVAAAPVRVGEGGPAFRACQAAGTPRSPDAPLPVRPAPFGTSEPVSQIAPGARFFLCGRSIDGRWFGIVFDPAGALSPACGVSAPLPRAGNYAGPCRSGWVASASVRTIAD